MLADIETKFVCEANQQVLMLCVSITGEVVFLHNDLNDLNDPNDLNYPNEWMTGSFADDCPYGIFYNHPLRDDVEL